MNSEQWKPIVGYEENYEISSLGRVKNKKTQKVLIGDKNNMGYKRVILYTPIKKRFFIHFLVAYHFCQGYKDGLVVNHIDGNKTNNAAENLEWVTRSENDTHAYRMGLRNCHIPFHKGNVFYQVYDYQTNIFLKEYPSYKEFKKDFPMSPQTFQSSVKRTWFYKDWRKRSLGKNTILRFFK